MPTTHWVDHRCNLVRAVATGVVTDADFRKWAAGMAAVAEVRAGTNELTDFRGVERFEVSPECIRDVVEMEARRGTRFHARRALVATQDVAYGMVRMYQALSEGDGERMGVFRDLSPALEWLGLVDVEL